MFNFKEFSVDDSLCAMKVGTDGVLLGAWADVEGCHSILDVGCGSGLIALMVAQRSQADILAIDIDEGALRQTEHNVANSPWAGRIRSQLADFRNFDTEQKFDHIISNPPFFVDALPSPDAVRSLARHTATLSFDDIVASACRLLQPEGRLSVILPRQGAAQFRYSAFGRLWLTRQMDISTIEGEEPKRVVMEFRLTAKPLMPRCTALAIHRKGGAVTDEYRRLTEEYYLKF